MRCLTVEQEKEHSLVYYVTVSIRLVEERVQVEWLPVKGDEGVPVVQIVVQLLSVLVTLVQELELARVEEEALYVVARAQVVDAVERMPRSQSAQINIQDSNHTSALPVAASV